MFKMEVTNQYRCKASKLRVHRLAGGFMRVLRPIEIPFVSRSVIIF
jgi:hypothetical protein